MNIQNDKATIELYGGSTRLAKKLKMTPQRVNQWKKRGIPASVKLAFPDLFLKRGTTAAAKAKKAGAA